MGQRKLIVDTDAGVDDAVALMMLFALLNRDEHALKATRSWDRIKTFGTPPALAGITCVGGNVELDKVQLNVVSCLRRAGLSEVPVFIGSERPLLNPPHSASFWHGEDGLGDVLSEAERKEDLEWAQKHDLLKGLDSYGNAAVNFIIKTIMESEKGTVDLLALGPLTNVALAIRIEPRIVERLGRCVIMGGAVRGRGNITKAAEFNFYADPDAAHICFDHLNGGFKSIELVDWEFCLRGSIEWDFWDRLREEHSNSFIVRMSEDIVKKSRALYSSSFPLADPLAMFVLLCPEGVTQKENRQVHIELSGNHTRGMTVVDWGTHELDVENAFDGHVIVEHIDMEAYHELIEFIALYQ